MSAKKVNDRDYLGLSTMLRAREARMLDRDRMDRMLSAPSYSEATKLLTDCGYEDMSGMNAAGVDAVLNAHREAVFDEIARAVPEPELVDAFRLKYDYHNAKTVIKAGGANANGEHLLSGCGRVSGEELRSAYEEEDYHFLPPALGRAMEEARRELSKTGNPQLADFILDRACFEEMEAMAKSVGSNFLLRYTRVLIDAANLRSAVRTVRMGRGQDFLMLALIPGGSVSPDRIAQAAVSGDGLTAVFNSSGFSEAAHLGAEAMKGGSMTKFELACDNAVTAFLGGAKLVSFGSEPVVEYLALVEVEITAVRMILSGRLADIEPDVIRERLRDISA